MHRPALILFYLIVDTENLPVSWSSSRSEQTAPGTQVTTGRAVVESIALAGSKVNSESDSLRLVVAENIGSTDVAAIKAADEEVILVGVDLVDDEALRRLLVLGSSGS